MKSFIEKYKPKKIEDIPQDTDMLKKIIEKKQHAIIFGPAGSCKTTAVYAIAENLDYEIIEMNASDFRTKDQIESIIGEASKQQSLFQREKLLLIDEVDCLAGNDDRGGAQAIVNVLKTSKFPIILTANDPYSDKSKEIKKFSTIIEFSKIKVYEIEKILEKICKSEKIEHDKESINNIAVNSNGDIRGAINDLQSSIIKNKIEKTSDIREHELDIMHILNNIFKTNNINANRLLENSNINLDGYLLWIDENLPLICNQKDLEKCYELMSKGDLFKGRIRKWQYWRLMYYQSLLVTSGISISKKNAINSFIQYKRPMRLLKIWQTNMKNAKKKTIAEKISKHTHTSIKDIIKNFRYYKDILKIKNIADELNLEIEEREFINKY